jgi:hypothetical protein
VEYILRIKFNGRVFLREITICTEVSVKLSKHYNWGEGERGWKVGCALKGKSLASEWEGEGERGKLTGWKLQSLQVIQAERSK